MRANVAVVLLVVTFAVRRLNAGICDDWLEQLDMSAETNETVGANLPPCWLGGASR